jgi:hypothetical protein
MNLRFGPTPHGPAGISSMADELSHKPKVDPGASESLSSSDPKPRSSAFLHRCSRPPMLQGEADSEMFEADEARGLFFSRRAMRLF